MKSIITGIAAISLSTFAISAASAAEISSTTNLTPEFEQERIETLGNLSGPIDQARRENLLIKNLETEIELKTERFTNERIETLGNLSGPIDQARRENLLIKNLETESELKTQRFDNERFDTLTNLTGPFDQARQGNLDN